VRPSSKMAIFGTDRGMVIIFLPPVICHQKVSRRARISVCVLGNLTQLEMCDSAIDPDVADAIKESSLFHHPAAPTAEQLANPDHFLSFAFPGAASRVEQQLLDQTRYEMEIVSGRK